EGLSPLPYGNCLQPIRAQRGVALRRGTRFHRHRVQPRDASRSHHTGGPKVSTELDTTVATLPVVPLKNTVLFPHLFMPLSVGRPGSLAAAESVLASEDKTFVVVAQKDSQNDQPGF